MKEYPGVYGVQRDARAKVIMAHPGTVEAGLFKPPTQYPTAEAFVKAQGKPLYHGTTRENAKKILKEGFSHGRTGGYGAIFFADRKSTLKVVEFGDAVVEAYIYPNKIFDVDNSAHIKAITPWAKRECKRGWLMEGDLESIENGSYQAIEDTGLVPHLIEKGYDGYTTYEGDGKNYAVFNPAVIKTKKQLIEIWNYAHRRSNARSKSFKAYHGTRAGQITQFIPKYRKQQLGFGIHFTKDKSFAMRYTQKGTSRGNKPMLYEVGLSISNPLKADEIVFEGSPEYALAVKLYNNRYKGDRDERGLRGLYMQNAIDATSNKRAERLIQEAGYDAIIYKAKMITRHGATPGSYFPIADATSYVVFSPEQVRIKKVL